MGSAALIIDCNHHIEPKSNFNNFRKELLGDPKMFGRSGLTFTSNSTGAGFVTAIINQARYFSTCFPVLRK
jgi:hypothetical protein